MRQFWKYRSSFSIFYSFLLPFLKILFSFVGSAFGRSVPITYPWGYGQCLVWPNPGLAMMSALMLRGLILLHSFTLCPCPHSPRAGATFSHHHFLQIYLNLNPSSYKSFDFSEPVFSFFIYIMGIMFVLCKSCCYWENKMRWLLCLCFKHCKVLWKKVKEIKKAK